MDEREQVVRMNYALCNAFTSARQFDTPMHTETLYDMAKYMVRKGFKQRTWIPVAEQPPVTDGDYLCAFDDGFICTASYRHEEWELWADAGEVTHWMPLPEPPVEEQPW